MINFSFRQKFHRRIIFQLLLNAFDTKLKIGGMLISPAYGDDALFTHHLGKFFHQHMSKFDIICSIKCKTLACWCIGVKAYNGDSMVNRLVYKRSKSFIIAACKSISGDIGSSKLFNGFCLLLSVLTCRSLPFYNNLDVVFIA